MTSEQSLLRRDWNLQSAQGVRHHRQYGCGKRHGNRYPRRVTAADASKVFNSGFTLDNAGTIYFTDQSHSIRTITSATGILGSVGPVPVSASHPVADSAGNLFFLSQNQVLRLAGGVVSVLANSSGGSGFSGDGGSAISAQLSNPSALAIASNGDIYVLDAGNRRVRVIKNQTGTIATIAGNGSNVSSGDGGLATSAGISSPQALTLDGNGNIYFGEFAKVRKVNLNTGLNHDSGRRRLE